MKKNYYLDKNQIEFDKIFDEKNIFKSFYSI